MSRLERLDDGLWLAEGEIVSFYGFPYPTRSVIVRLTDGGLRVWSPVRLADELRGEVERLGDVAHLVSPNKLHHLYLAEWKSAYPEATLWGPQSTIRRRELTFEPPVRCPAGRMGIRLRSGVVSRLAGVGRDRLLPPSVADGALRRSYSGARRPVPAPVLVLVAAAAGSS